MKIEIVQPKIKGKTDSFFYEGEIATATKPNGTILSLIATGDILICIDDEGYFNGNRDTAIDKYGLTDRKLRTLENKGRLSWQNNNWFEVLWREKDSEEWQSEIGDVAYDYDEAIELLKSYYEDNAY